MSSMDTSASQSSGSQIATIVARLATTGEVLARVQASATESVFALRQAIAQNLGTSNFWLCCGFAKMPDHDLLSSWGLSQGGDVGVIRAASAADTLQPPANHEVELVVRDAFSYEPGKAVRSYWRTVGSMRFRLLVFPTGTLTTNGSQVSAFIEPCSEDLPPNWEYKSVKYRIAVLNWKNPSQSNVKVDTFSFSATGKDRGWHDLVSTQALKDPELGWCGPDSSICIRAAVISIRAIQTKPCIQAMLGETVTRVGLQHAMHDDSCVSGLVQSLFHIGKFRSAALSSESRCLSMAPGHINMLDATRQIFARLEAATEAVPCGELYSAFGRHFPDLFSSPSVPCLHTLLLEEFSTEPTAATRTCAMRDLFRGCFKHSMNCPDGSHHCESEADFFELRLSVIDSHGKHIHTLEDSVRHLLREPQESTYDAGAELGKQRKKRRTAVTRWPPVLSIQLDRFRSDATLDSRFVYPSRLDLSEFGAEDGTYALHSVLVHTGLLVDHCFHAYVRASVGAQRRAGQEGSPRWASLGHERLAGTLSTPQHSGMLPADSSPSFLAADCPADWPVVCQGPSRRKRRNHKACKFDIAVSEACKFDTVVSEHASVSSSDRQWLRFEGATVSSSFESAAVQANFGGAAAIFEHEIMVFESMGASESFPGERSFKAEATRAHRACGLVYVRESDAAEVLSP